MIWAWGAVVRALRKAVEHAMPVVLALVLAALPVGRAGAQQTAPATGGVLLPSSGYGPVTEVTTSPQPTAASTAPGSAPATPGGAYTSPRPRPAGTPGATYETYSTQRYSPATTRPARIILPSGAILEPLPTATETTTPGAGAPAPSAPPEGDGATATGPGEGSPAEGIEGGVVERVRVSGNQRIERATVESYLLLREGDRFDPLRMDRSLKELFATGLFSDVEVRREGNELVVEVEENPVINRLVFEGNSKIEDDKLQEEIDLRPRVVYTRTKVQNAVRRISTLYQRSGRFAARVEPKIIRLDQNRVDLVFEIDEGEVTGIKKINFIGNTEFSDFRLKGVIATKETAWWRILSSNDTYDPDRLAFDRDALRRFYLNNGYADFSVISAVAELAPDKSGFFVTFTVEEGKQYTIGRVEVNSQIEEIDRDLIQNEILVQPGEIYDGEEVEKSVDEITDRVGELGYAFVDIRPRTLRDRENREVHVVFQIAEAPRVFIERINIVGNTRTLDRVIRREFRLVEGDAFNTAKLQRTETRIDNLGFFEEVELRNRPGSRPDLTVIEVEVKEQPTGEFSLGAGFSSGSGALGQIGIRERNFLGRGQDVRANFTISQRNSAIDVGFTEPYFLDRDVSAGFDLFLTQQDFDDESSFEQNSVGLTLRLAYNLSERIRHGLNYTLRRDDIEGTEIFLSPIIRGQEGERSTSSISHFISYDTRDSRQNTTRGWFATLSNTLAGLGGGERFIRSEIRGGYYYPFDQDWIGLIRASAGNVFGFGGRTVRITNRFFVGGDNLRGFEPAGIGPRDLLFDDALGGNQSFTGTLQLEFPTPVPDELGVKGRIFSDFGLLTEIDEIDPNIVDAGSLRASAGIGVSWDSPFGPISVDLGRAILKEDHDELETFRVSFGTRF